MSFDLKFVGGASPKAMEVHVISTKIAKGFGNHAANVSCEVGRTSDGRGITVRLYKTANGRSHLILLPEDEWKKPGLIEAKVRESLRHLGAPELVERCLQSQ